MSLIVMLNDIRRLGIRGHGDDNHNDDAIRMPVACLAIVPLFDLSLKTIPSSAHLFLHELFFRLHRLSLLIAIIQLAKRRH